MEWNARWEAVNEQDGNTVRSLYRLVYADEGGTLLTTITIISQILGFSDFWLPPGWSTMDWSKLPTEFLKRHKLEWFGHVCRCDAMPQIILPRTTVDGSCRRGKPRRSCNYIKKWIDQPLSSLLRIADETSRRTDSHRGKGVCRNDALASLVMPSLRFRHAERQECNCMAFRARSVILKLLGWYIREYESTVSWHVVWSLQL